MSKLRSSINKEHCRTAVFGAACILAANLWVWGSLQNDVLDAAYSIPNGGGYSSLRGSGVNETIKHKGSVILPASDGGWYCCGFTFAVAVRTADERGLLKNKSVAEIRRLQQQWYGVAEGAAKRQCAVAVSDAGIGREIDLEKARSGDFIIFFRTNGFGHSVVFLDWIRDGDGQIVGLSYRSSQPDTDGVSDCIDYFSDVGMGSVDRATVFVARLNRPWWSRMLYPLAG